jgi:hypothetical protein
MAKIKEFLEFLDLAVKVFIAVMAFFVFGLQKERLALQTTQVELQQKQLSLLQTQQTQSLVVAEKIIALLFEEKNKCLAEDQAFLIDFLIDTHNTYNTIKIIKADFIRASSARRSCSNAPAAGKGTTGKDEGPLPLVTPDNAGKAIREVSPPTTERPEGTAFVAVGAFDRAKKTFRNFAVPAATTMDDGSIAAGTVIKAFWSVYLRSNTSDTTDNANPKLGVLDEGSCAKVERSTPGVRGQTWALVRPVPCGAK